MIWNHLGRISTVNYSFNKDVNFQIHQHKAFFSDDQFLDPLHKSFLNQTTLDLRKEKCTFLNREFTTYSFACNCTSADPLEQLQQHSRLGTTR